MITVSSDVTCNCGCKVTVKYEVVIKGVVVEQPGNAVNVTINTYDKD